MSTAVEALKTKAAAQPGTLKLEDLIKNSADQLKMALPAHMRPERIVRIALTTLKMNPTLYQCDPYTFLGALFQAAQLGLEVNLNGEAYIIPYRVKGVLQAQFQIGYQGLIKLFWNHQSALSLQAEAIHEKDVFSYDNGTGEIHHKPDILLEDRGRVIGYYAVGALANGGRTIKVMSYSEVLAFAKRYSKCYDKQSGKFMPNTPWATEFDAMAKKTVIKQLMKLLPKSVEIQRALAADETVKSLPSNIPVGKQIDMVGAPNQIPADDYIDDESPLADPKKVEAFLKTASSAGLKDGDLLDFQAKFCKDPSKMTESELTACMAGVAAMLDAK